MNGRDEDKPVCSKLSQGNHICFNKEKCLGSVEVRSDRWKEGK